MSAAQFVAWRDVEAGSVVRLKGGDWRVDRVKVKGKRARVRVSGRAGTFERDLKAKDRVELVMRARRKGESVFAPLAERYADPGPGPLRDERGAQRRWATDEEAKRDAPPSLGLPGGRHGAKPQPETGKGPRWDAPATDPAGRAVEGILGARLVAETPDEPAGYFVPPVDVTTVRAHLLTFHGMPGHEQPLDEARALEVHRRMHDDGEVAPVNHWHSKRRPGPKSPDLETGEQCNG